MGYLACGIRLASDVLNSQSSSRYLCSILFLTSLPILAFRSLMAVLVPCLRFLFSHLTLTVINAISNSVFLMLNTGVPAICRFLLLSVNIVVNKLHSIYSIFKTLQRFATFDFLHVKCRFCRIVCCNKLRRNIVVFL